MATAEASAALRFPSLVLPFAALGATVGYSAVTLLGHPLVDRIRYTWPLDAGIAGGVAAGVVGAILTRVGRRRAARDDAWIRPSRYGVVLVSTLLAAGAAAGVAVSGFGAAGTGAAWGVTCAAAALPLAAAVLRVGLRAQRGRLGSIVAAADRRAVWAMCAVATSIASVTSSVGWIDVGWHGPMPPWLGMIAALLGAITLGWTAVLDAAALRRVREIAANPALRARVGHAGAEDVERLDLGLGDAVHVEVTPGASAYRAVDRARRVVLGSADEAAAALKRTVQFGVAGLGVAVMALLAHAAAGAPEATYASERALCERNPLFCGATARSAIARGAGDDRVVDLLARACTASDMRACAELGDEIARLDDAAFHVNPAGVLALVLTCRDGDGAACYAVVRHARH